MITFDLTKNVFSVPGAWSPRIKPAPDRKYLAAKRVWEVPMHAANKRFLLDNFMERDFDPAAWAAINAVEAAPTSYPAVQWPPFLLAHQTEALDRAWGLSQFAFFHGMGSGKSNTFLQWAKALYDHGFISEVWVVCPNSLIDNWWEQMERWAPELKPIFNVYGILSLSTGKLPKQLVERSHKKLLVGVDESQRIKNAQAARTKVMHSIGKNCGYRAVLTGTSITKGMEDLYSQYFFLDPMIIGHKSFFTFRNRYCQMGGFENKQIVGYHNTNELMGLVKPFTDVVTDPVPLPEMGHESRWVNLSPEQKRLLDELKNDMETEMAGERLTVDNALAYYTRGAQIIGGFFPVGEGRVARLANNPKLDELTELILGTDQKVVVFCRFRAEQALILEAMAAHGVLATEIKAKDPSLQANVNAFQSNDRYGPRVIVATYAMGSVGFTLTAGRVLAKYSGTFNFEDEAQSEKRIHRIGQEHTTMATRIMAKCKIDRQMLAISQGKASIADFVNGCLQTNPRSLSGILDYE